MNTPANCYADGLQWLIEYTVCLVDNLRIITDQSELLSKLIRHLHSSTTHNKVTIPYRLKAIATSKWKGAATKLGWLVYKGS